VQKSTPDNLQTNTFGCPLPAQDCIITFPDQFTGSSKGLSTRSLGKSTI
jgi:hypothetical protein